MKTIILISDTVPPDINGVATTLKNYLKYLNQDHYCIKVISPNLYKTIPCPFSPDVKLAYGIRIDKSVFEGEFAVHLLTEGPLGIAYRNYCIRQKIKFTTSYLTMFPEYLREYLKVPLLLSRIYFRWFHKRSAGVFCCTKELIAKNQWLNHKNLVICRKGVDTTVFTYKNKIDPTIPTLLYVGRVAKEKNLEDFCKLKVASRKVIVGEGPFLLTLKEKYKEVEFLGKLTGQKLVEVYQNAAVFVFPSQTDTFGLVMLEALSCGTPVVAYPVNGALDLQRSGTVFCNSDLNLGVIEALENKDNWQCRKQALEYDWSYSVSNFMEQLVFNRLKNNTSASKNLSQVFIES